MYIHVLTQGTMPMVAIMYHWSESLSIWFHCLSSLNFGATRIPDWRITQSKVQTIILKTPIDKRT